MKRQAVTLGSLLLGIFIGFLIGCGGSGSSSDGGSGASANDYSCHYRDTEALVEVKADTCVDYHWDGAGVDPRPGWKAACSDPYGRHTEVDRCSRSGAVGGCQVTTTSDGATTTAVTWVYADAPGATAGSVMMSCRMAGGVFVAP